MGKLIELDIEDIELLKNEIAYLIKKEKSELERLMQDRDRSMIPDAKVNDQFIENSKRILSRLTTLYSKLEKSSI